tara:strand:+ start:248 stop:1201 length:954 start_codon:yes stop_codon:yes gene_type:complete
MEQYTQDLVEYYREKYVNYNKKKCDGCKDIKEFIETNDSLIYTCGASKGDCSVQIKINLIKYKDTNTISELKTIINESLNYEIINKYFNLKSDIDYKNIQTKIDLINKDYEIQNNIIQNEKMIINIIEQRVQLYEEMDTNNPIEYVENSIKLNLLYKQILDIIKNISSIVVIEYPKPSQKKQELEETKLEQKQEKEITKKILKLPEIKLENGNKIKWIFRNIFKYGIIKKVNKKKSIIESFAEYVVDNTKIHKITDEEYENNTKNILEIIKIGSTVKWLNKNLEIQVGKIKKLNKVKAIVATDNQYEYIVDYKKMFL